MTQELPADVRRLVVAARVVAFENQGRDEIKELDAASEAFADRVPWQDDPEISLAESTDSASVPLSKEDADMTPTRSQMLKAIDRMVSEGRAEHTMIDGKPGIRLIKKDDFDHEYDGLGRCGECGHVHSPNKACPG